MRPKSLAVAALSAVALIGVGLAVQELRQPPRAAAQAGSRLYPELLDRVNDVVALSVTTPDGAYRVSRADGVWGLEEKGGYPVDAGQVSKTLIGLAELATIEPKTSDPARYADIGVEDPDAEGAKSKLVTLHGEGGAELASLIVGERRAGRGTPSFYVRKAGEAGSWLVSGDLDLRTDGLGWLDKKILELKRDQVRAVETVQPDGASVLVSKPARDATNFEVHEVPPERELKYETVANGMGSALEYLNLQDVVPAAEFEAPEAEPVRSSFWTFDGLRVDVEVLDKDGKAYARFRASYEPEGPARLADAVGPTPPPEAEGEESETEEVVAEVTRPAEEVREEAEELDARLSAWVFEIPAYNKTNLTKRLEDLLAEPVVEEAVEDEDSSEEGFFAPDELTPPDDVSVEPPAEDPGAAQPIEPPADEPVSDEPPADEPPADQPPADEPPADEPPADEPPADEPPADKPPGDGR